MSCKTNIEIPGIKNNQTNYYNELTSSTKHRFVLIIYYKRFDYLIQKYSKRTRKGFKLLLALF